MRRIRYQLAAAFVIVVIATSVYIYRTGRTGESQDKSLAYKEYAVKRGTFTSVVSADGSVVPIDRVEIKSKASGRVEELPVEAGDFVSRGSLICRLDQTDVRADMDQAQADLEIAQAEIVQAQNTYDRREQLFKKQLISQEEFDQVTLQLAQAKGKLVGAQTALDRTRTRMDETVVTAPIDGVILQKYVEIGQIIASGISNVGGGTRIADVADMRRVYIEAGIDEIDVGKVRIDQEATVVAAAYPSLIFSGKIVRIAPEARVVQNVTLFDIIIEVGNIDGKLKSGMNVNAEVTVVRDDNALLIPVLAMNEPKEASGSRNSRRVLVKQGDSFVPREIEIGLTNAGEAVIVSGLTDGDTVGVPMTSRLKDENDRMEQEIKGSRGFGTSNAPPTH
jgi:HlyD family secretion protein